MFFFSAATYNGHRIHYDKEWARTGEGYEAVLVHGPLQAALLARAIGDWIGGRGRLVSFAVQNRAIAYPGEPLAVGGEVTGKRLTENRAGLVDLDIAGRRDDTVLMLGTATVELPRRGRAPRRGDVAKPPSSAPPSCPPNAVRPGRRCSLSTSTRCWRRWSSRTPGSIR